MLLLACLGACLFACLKNHVSKRDEIVYSTHVACGRGLIGYLLTAMQCVIRSVDDARDDRA